MPATTSTRHKYFVIVFLIAAMVIAAAPPARASEDVSPEPLRKFSESIEALVKRVAPSVVQVLVTGYGPVNEDNDGDAGVVIGRQRATGSGVIIAADGYIVTNAHVVRGGQRVQVVLSEQAAREDSPMGSVGRALGRVVDAKVVGTAPEVDLAVLKVDVEGLPPLPLADYRSVRQGQLVFAFGSPEGLRNTVTMGVVSAVARQPDPDHPMVYIQTDAPVNPGNSGGPLVNASGEVLGINTFILSQSGGSEGLGFAIPSAIVNVAYPQMRRFGRLHRSEIGMNVQTITPDLASGLKLARDSGVIVSDVVPGGPADAAGLQAGDVILALDGAPMDSLPLFAFRLFTRSAGDKVTFDVLRGNAHALITVPVVERIDHSEQLADLVHPETNQVHQLGIVAAPIDDRLHGMLAELRIPSGVLVAARAQEPLAADVSLAVGDVIHSVNGVAVSSIEELREDLEVLAAAHQHSAVVLQIEREGKLSYVAFELD
ncbi:MAG TPA: trypsin-like peptidase domain-containing protein [Vicinamibacterales bacterium]